MTPLPDREADPKRLGDFEVLREIGRGGMGVVYEARQVSLNRKVALKVLAAGLGLSAQGAQRFRREAEAAAKLHHSNIVPVYATGEQDGTLFYAMELIKGPSLHRLIGQMRQGHGALAAAEGPAPGTDPEQTGPYVAGAGKTSELVTAAGSSEFSSDSHYFDAVARAVAEVADALEHAHKNGVIHRDVKPSNLLVSPDGRLSLTDFGLARVLEQPGMTLSGEFVGTPRYMSPEQIAAGRTPLDHRTDVYSLGATLYELLTLRPPFPGERREQVLAQVMHKDPTPPRRLNRRVPVDLETICLKALEKDPDRRYQTAGQMAEDLRRYVNRFAIRARRAGPVERLKKWVKRHPGLAAGLACALLAVAAASYFAFQAHQSEQQRQGERDQQAQELAQQKRQSAMEKALLLAMGGDLAEAERAIGEAEVRGASTGELRMLRGQVALYRGQAREAVAHLEKAIELSPESVAARSMLMMAYRYVGQFEKCLAQCQAIERLPEKTPEDYLFKSYAETGYKDLGSGVKALDEAIRQHPSTLARLIRADVLGNRAQETGAPADVERAIEEANAIRQALPDNAMALWVSLQAHFIAADAYQEAGQQAKSQTALAQAGRDANRLKRFPTLPLAVYGRFCYLQHIGQEMVLLEELSQLSEQTDVVLVTNAYLYLLAQCGKYKAALAIADSRGGSWAVDYMRVHLLAEMHGDSERTLSAYRALAARYPGNNVVGNHAHLLLLGRKAESVVAARRERRVIEKVMPLPPWVQRQLDYECDLISPEQLLDSTPTRGARGIAYYFIGFTKLAEGDRAGAREYLRKLITSYVLFPSELDYVSRLTLARMEKDPTWPPWIPVKK